MGLHKVEVFLIRARSSFDKTRGQSGQDKTKLYDSFKNSKLSSGTSTHTQHLVHIRGVEIASSKQSPGRDSLQVTESHITVISCVPADSVQID